MIEGTWEKRQFPVKSRPLSARTGETLSKRLPVQGKKLYNFFKKKLH